jgi:hypothetical protein
MYLIYKHIFPNGKVYIGLTSGDGLSRWGSNGIHYKGQNLVWNAIQKYGWKNVKHEILYTNLTKEEASKIEIEMISKYKSNDSNYGYNLTAGGEGGSFGYHHSTSDETKRKIGYKNSIALKGRKLPEEVRLKVSRANMGILSLKKLDKS